MGVRKYMWWALAALPLCAAGQFVDYGTDAARYRWREVRTGHYRLIYPQGIDSLARRYAGYLEAVARRVGRTEELGAFPVVLHPGDMRSNGMVSWAPRRMELLTTPSYGLVGQRWAAELTLHESRHVVQMSRLVGGVFHPLYYVMGEQAAGVAAAFVPSWWLEGDAVAMETGLSFFGRGRRPEFMMPLRAQAVAGDFYSFDKWYLGSYRDYTGDYYALGYALSAYARYRYGADVWNKALERYVRRPLSLRPFGNAFRKSAGTSVDELFGETFAYLKEEWARMDSLPRIVPHYLTTEGKDYASYQYPQALDDSVVIAVKSTLSDIASLTAIAGRKERRLSYVGSLAGRTGRNGRDVYWLEYVPGRRWEHENFTVLKHYDSAEGKVSTLTPRGRYIAAALNDSLLALSLFAEAGESRIVVRRRSGGNERVYPLPDNALGKSLALGGDGAAYVVAVGEGGTSLLRLDLSAGEWRELLPPVRAGIDAPLWSDGRLFFESGLSGTNNIYSLDLRNGETRRLTSARFGAFQPALSMDGKRLLYADYQAKGYRLASLPLDSLPGETADFAHPYHAPLAEALSAQENWRLDTAALPPVAFTPRPYRKAAHLFRFHSWAPVYYDAGELLSGGSTDFSTTLYPGVSLFSQNALNTAVTQIGAFYADGSWRSHLYFAYTGLLPVIDLDIDCGDKAFDVKWNNETFYSTYSRRSRLIAKARAYIPIDLTTNHYIRGLQPSLSYTFTNHRFQQYPTRRFGYYQYVLAELRLYNYLRMAQRDLRPRRGYQAKLQYLALPFNTHNYGNLYAASLTAYLPGLLPNHSLMLRGAYQYQSAKSKPLYVAIQLLDPTRGFDNYLYQSLHLFTWKADYAFALFCPDLRIGSLCYLRRIRANLFTDTALSIDRDNWTTQTSCGGDFLIDCNVFRLRFPLSAGVRLSRPIFPNATPRAETLLSIAY